MEYRGIARVSILNKSVLGIRSLFVSPAYTRREAVSSIECTQKLAFHPLSSIASTSVTETADTAAPLKAPTLESYKSQCSNPHREAEPTRSKI